MELHWQDWASDVKNCGCKQARTLGNQPTIGIALTKRCVCAKLKTLLTVLRGLVFGHRT